MTISELRLKAARLGINSLHLTLSTLCEHRQSAVDDPRLSATLDPWCMQHHDNRSRSV